MTGERRDGVLHRLFFALLPPPGLATAIAAERDALGLGGSPVRADRLHVTLLLGEDHPALLPALVAAMLRAGDTVSTAPFHVIFDETVHRRGLLTLRPSEPIPALDAFRRGLASACVSEGVPSRAGHRFSPHISLLYGREAPAAPLAPASWRADDFVLIHSHVGLTRHDVIRRWPLSEPRRPSRTPPGP